MKCAPDLWRPQKEEVDATNRRIYQVIVQNLIHWNKAYRSGEPISSDYKYDLYEGSLKKTYPNHPIFDMVGHDDEKAKEALEFIPKTKQNPILE